jgi:glycosyltransferase involved in cell wall biosynthesis
MVKLSIIIPVYNVEKYIQKCLESVFIQDVICGEYEVIVVDDGTLDNSMEIVENFANEYPNLKIIRQSNQGLSAARNAGLKMARGEYVWFVDSDDWIEKNCLEEIFSLLNTYQSEVFVTPLKSKEESTGKINSDSFLGVQNIGFSNGINFLKDAVRITPVQIYLFNRCFLEKHNLKFMNGVYHEDAEFAPRMLYFTKQVCLINKCFYNYLIRESGSITSGFSIKKSEDLILIIKSLDNFSKANKLNFKEKQYFNLKKIGCLYALLSNLSKCKDVKIVKQFMLKHFWFIKRLSLESIFAFYPRFAFYGTLLFVDYRLLFLYLKYK